MKVKGLVFLLAVVLAVLSWTDSAQTSRDYWPTEKWRTSSPRRQGLDAGTLKKMDAFVRSDLPQTSSVLVVRHGYVVFERYYEGDATRSRSMWNETQSVMSALIGIAIDKGYLAGVEQGLLELLPDSVTDQTNPAASKVTLRHLLTLSDGIATQELDFYFEPRRLTEQFRAEPGESFFYNNLSPQVLSVIITKRTGLKAAEFAQEHLLKPLGITSAFWATDWGYTRGGFGMSLSTHDMARFGYLYLNNGRWEGQQIIPEQWVADSTRPQIRTGCRDESWGTYGYLWWPHSFGGHSGYLAAGAGGQLIVVLPHLDLVTVITSADLLEVDPAIYLAIVDKVVVPAVKR